MPPFYFILYCCWWNYQKPVLLNNKDLYPISRIGYLTHNNVLSLQTSPMLQKIHTQDEGSASSFEKCNCYYLPVCMHWLPSTNAVVAVRCTPCKYGVVHRRRSTPLNYALDRVLVRGVFVDLTANIDDWLYSTWAAFAKKRPRRTGGHYDVSYIRIERLWDSRFKLTDEMFLIDASVQ